MSGLTKKFFIKNGFTSILDEVGDYELKKIGEDYKISVYPLNKVQCRPRRYRIWVDILRESSPLSVGDAHLGMCIHSQEEYFDICKLLKL